MFALSQIISGATGLIYMTFSPNDRYLFVDDQSGPLFSIPQDMWPWQPIFCKNLQNDLHLTGWHSEMDRNMAVLIQKYSMATL